MDWLYYLCRRRPTSPTSNINAMLPVELIAEIVEWAALDPTIPQLPRYSTLCALSGVCRLWESVARRELFRNVFVESRSQAESFSAALVSSPHLGPYVRLLKIAPYTLKNYTAFANCFILLPNIQELDLGMQHDLNSTAVNIIRKAPCTLKAFRFSDVENVTRLLVLPPWKSLELLEYDERPIPLNCSPLPRPRPRETRLRPPGLALRQVRWNGRCDATLLWSISNSKDTLRVLRLSEYVSQEAAQCILATFGPSLTSLDLTGAHYPNIQHCLRACVNLGELTISDAPSEALLRALPESLEQLHFAECSASSQPLVEFIKTGPCIKLRVLTLRYNSMMGFGWQNLYVACALRDISFRQKGLDRYLYAKARQLHAWTELQTTSPSNRGLDQSLTTRVPHGAMQDAPKAARGII